MVSSNTKKIQHNAVALSIDYLRLTVFLVFLKFEVETK